MITLAIPLLYVWIVALTMVVPEIYSSAKQWLSDRFQADEETLDAD